MHQVRFLDPAGTVRVGEWADAPDGEIRAAGRTYDPAAVELLPPAEPTKVVCVGLNYADHAEESGAEVPDRPLLFLKPPSALAAHGDTVPLPADKEVDYEAELAVVVGEQCRNLEPAEAMDAVAGFTCANDVSNRTDQRVEQNWVRGKAFDNSCPLGPVLATPDEVPDDARVSLRLNGETRQDARIDQFIFGLEELLAEITGVMTLEPGDVIITGTPAGVGPLEDGDRVAVEVEGVGVLENDVEREGS